MCKKLICLISLVAVLVMAQNASAGLVGYWKFDEGSGTTVMDSSGRGNHGTFGGKAAWGQGTLGGSLSLDGSSWVDIPAAAWSPIERQVTVAFWAFGGDAMPVNHFVFAAYSADTNAARQASAHIPWGSGTMYWDTGYDGANYDRVSAVLPAQYQKGAWVHWVFTKSVDTGTVNVYINGALFLSGTGTTRPIRGVNAFTIGAQAITGHPNGYIGRLDDFRLYDRAMTADEALSLFNGVPPTWPKAEAPSPADGAYHADTWVNLGWKPGEFAVSHDVYLGDNFNDVNAGTSDVFRGNVSTPSLLAGFPGFAYPGGLVPGTTYYWRVDEVNVANPSSPWKGNIWSFTVPPKTAYDPAPADSGKFVPLSVTLRWTGGLRALLHTVYFGDTFDGVNNATGGSPLTTTSYTPAGPLEQGKTYYWRVDEFDGAATHKGDVWSFETIPVVAVSDPNMVVLWTLNEGMGTTAVDWSGHGHHGTITGAAQWVDGFEGTALKFADNVYVESSYQGITGTRARTCCAWIKTTTANRNIMSWGQNVATQKWRMRLDATGGLRIENNGGYNYGVTNLADGLWHHVAVVFPDDGSPDILDTLLFVDGRPEMSAASQANAVATAAGPLRIGESPWHNAPWLDVIDEARVYNKALTQEQIASIMRVDPLLAWAEKPVDGSTPDIEHVIPLTWTRGDKATQHEVYFGLDKAAVVNADASDTTGLYRGRQSTTSYTPAEGVTWGGGPYFWRVDENNSDGTVTKGRIWSFSVGDFLVVDDIESYNDLLDTEPGSNRIYTKWIDGFGTTTNGAFVGNQNVPLTEHANIRGGGQAMPLSYDNNLKFSEATLTLTSGNDWTRQGVTDLSLWFRGLAANAAERMYVVLNGTAVVYNDDTSLTQKTAWTQWTIPLQQFAAQGVNLTNVTSITIGFGTRGNTTTVGGTGQMYFDDIRLYR